MALVHRTATLTWDGTIARGEGHIVAESGAFTRLPVTSPSRMMRAGEAGKTSPEELLAAAHATCFTMALGAGLAGDGTPPQQLVTRVTYTLETAQGKWAIVSAALFVRGRVDGISADSFAAAVDGAATNCVVSKAVSGNVEIRTEFELLPAQP